MRRFNDVAAPALRLDAARHAPPRRRGAWPTSSCSSWATGRRWRWSALLGGFLGVRVVDGIGQVRGDIYVRTLAVDVGAQRHLGWVRLEHVPKRTVLRVTLSGTLAHAIPQSLGKVAAAARPGLPARRGGPPSWRPCRRCCRACACRARFDGFEIAVRAIVGQVISVIQARRILTRLVSLTGEPLPPKALAGLAEALAGCPAMAGQPPLTHVFPTAQALADLPDGVYREAGVTPAKLRDDPRWRSASSQARSRSITLAPPEETVAWLPRDRRHRRLDRAVHRHARAGAGRTPFRPPTTRCGSAPPSSTVRGR